MQLNPGDTVKVIDENMEGVVLSVGKTIVVKIDGFEFDYQPKEVVKIQEDQNLLDLYAQHLPTSNHIKPEDKPKTKGQSDKEKAIELGRVRGKRNTKNILEFDLHIHDLLVKSDHMTSGEMLNYQLDYAVNCLEQAIKLQEQTIVFIHGIGKGVLKIELHRIIRAYGFDFQDGFMNEYGYGATRVELR